MESTKQSNRMDWILFGLSTIVMVLLLMYASEWFWLALPFSGTFLAKALNVL